MSAAASAPVGFVAGGWTIEVSMLEPSTLTVTMSARGEVSGRQVCEGLSGSVEGTWRYDAPVLTLRLESRMGSSTQPLDYEIVLSGGEPLRGTDTDGHHFTLTPAT